MTIWKSGEHAAISPLLSVVHPASNRACHRKHFMSVDKHVVFPDNVRTKGRREKAGPL